MTFKQTERNPNSLPDQVEGVFIHTEDGERLEVWKKTVRDSPAAVVIFHGNAGTVANYYHYQRLFNQAGLTSYGFDYRGYGKSSGWPSEEGLYKDADAVIEFVLKDEQIEVEQLIVVGISIGSGPASYAAEKFKTKVLILYAPFSSLKHAASEVPFFGLLSPFLFHDFPVENRVARLDDSCLIVVHGRQDTIIPFPQGEQVFSAYRGSGLKKFIQLPDAGHNDLLHPSGKPVVKAIADCLETT